MQNNENAAILSNSLKPSHGFKLVDADAEYFNNIKRRVDEEDFPVGSKRRKELVDKCKKHFSKMEINEKDILPWFVYNVRNRGKILKMNPPLAAGKSPILKTRSS
jgi:hypothetical protein